MAGIYLHIPFCTSRCHYCNFYSVVSRKYRPYFVDALIKELEIQKDYLEGQKINTIYFGGGTPSLLKEGELNRIFDRINQYFSLDDNAEISLEANPDDIDEHWVKELLNTPVNRLSIGIQSFHDEDLEYLRRRHNAQEAINAIRIVQDNGLNNLTADLIYGIPGLSNERWIKNLETFFKLQIPHLSAYALTVEDNTPLSVNIRKGKTAAPEEQLSIEHFKSLISLTRHYDYIHYEISNFALEGKYSRHNSIYWTGGQYLGLGPSAHSFNGRSRRWNKASLQDWIRLDNFYDEVFEEEVLTIDQRYNEYVMTSLRTHWGCDIQLINDEFSSKYANYIINESERFIHEGMLIKKKNRLYLTDKGKLFADGIASELFI